MARRTAEEAAKTREAILDAGLEVFSERGYAAAQLEDVAGRAGVTRGAFYHHFADKTELYVTILSERWAAVMAPALALLSGNAPPRERIRRSTIELVRLLGSDPRAQALMRMSMSSDLSLLSSEGSAADAAAAGSKASAALHGPRGLDEKASALDGWRRALASAFREAGLGARASARAEVLLSVFCGYAFLRALPGGATRRDPEAIADLVLDGVFG